MPNCIQIQIGNIKRNIDNYSNDRSHCLPGPQILFQTKAINNTFTNICSKQYSWHFIPWGIIVKSPNHDIIVPIFLFKLQLVQHISKNVAISLQMLVSCEVHIPFQPTRAVNTLSVPCLFLSSSYFLLKTINRAFYIHSHYDFFSSEYIRNYSRIFQEQLVK